MCVCLAYVLLFSPFSSSTSSLITRRLFILFHSLIQFIDNNINRIALFLTNGELKSDEENFPELTYGVGEGKIFEVDGRIFEELGGGE